MPAFSFWAGKNTNATAASTVNYAAPAMGRNATQTTTNEAVIQETIRIATVFSHIYMRVTTNAATGAGTFRSRVNGANGAQSVTVGAGATGEFEDTTNVDSVSAGDEFATAFTSGSGGTTTWTTWSIRSSAGVRYGCINGSVTVDSTTQYTPLTNSGFGTSGTPTEAAAQLLCRAAGVLSGLYLQIATNARSTTTTFKSRNNGADGALTVSVGSGATGVFEDTTNADTIAAGDLPCAAFVTGSGGGSMGFMYAWACVPDAQAFQALSQTSATSYNAGTTNWIGIGSSATSSTVTESITQVPAGVPVRLTTLQVYVSANTVLGTSTVTIRKNAANGANTVSFETLATGFFEDTTNTDVCAATDQLNYQVVIGAGGTSVNFTQFTCLVTAAEKARALMVAQAVNRAATF